MTDEQRTEVEKTVVAGAGGHGGDPQATLAATMDGRSLEAIGAVAGPDAAWRAWPQSARRRQVQGGHVVLGSSRRASGEPRERYTLTHLHAKGGMGRVWLARDGALGRQIALKELRPDQSDNSIVCSRFLYEAKITAQLEHPGIVPVYELGEGDAPYYTMRFVRGRTLSEAIRAYHKKRAAGEADSVGLVDLLTDVRQRLPRRGLRPFAGDHPPRPQGPERRAGGLRRGHRARLGPGQAGRPATRRGRTSRVPAAGAIGWTPEAATAATRDGRDRRSTCAAETPTTASPLARAVR